MLCITNETLIIKLFVSIHRIYNKYMYIHPALIPITAVHYHIKIETWGPPDFFSGMEKSSTITKKFDLQKAEDRSSF